MQEHREDQPQGLTKEEASRLEAYRKRYENAQAVADGFKAVVDELERKEASVRRSEMLRRIAEQSQRQPISDAFLLPKPDPKRCSFPKPARLMVIHRRFTVRNLLNPPPSPALPERDELIEQFEQTRSINAFSFNLGLRRSEAIKVLKKHGIDIYEEVARDWERGVPIRELSRRHGVGRDAISRWIKRTGRDVPVANSRKHYSDDVIVQTFKRTSSCNQAASAAGVAWRTAKDVLVRHGEWGSGS